MSGINGEGLKVKQRYTPGIWTVSIHDDNGEKVIRSSHDDGIVANLECDSYTKSSQEIEANAALIAAAPELLEACYAARVVLKHYGCPDKEALLDIEKAIAKAEGR